MSPLFPAWRRRIARRFTPRNEARTRRLRDATIRRMHLEVLEPRLLLTTDLTVRSVRAPLNAPAGTPVRVEWTVANQGSETIFGPWTDAIFLSDTPTLPPGVPGLGGPGLQFLALVDEGLRAPLA